MRYETGTDTAIARVALPVARPSAVALIERPGEAIARELRRNEETLAVLRRLGVEESDRLPLSFAYETGGAEADRELAAFLADEAGYEVTIEAEGVSGRTTPVQLSSEGLEVWARGMLRAGDSCGCAFAGWTATVSRS
jgi:hypothetical protein